jgi:integrase/recombinase XerC
VTTAVRATAADLDVAAIARWLETSPRSNNSVRADVTAVRTFLKWSLETGRLAHYRDTPYRRLLKSYPATYGKVQAKYPAVRMTKAQYENLTGACQDGTETGLRDELLIRLGVGGGMRTAELLAMTVGAVRRAPNLTWTGKANKQRTAHAGPALMDTIARYLARYEAGIDRPLVDDDPLFCVGLPSHSHPGCVNWSHPVVNPNRLRTWLTRRAKTAGLDHLSPHDLKHSAARMMHEARSADGGHIFDLLEIAEVMDHSNPKVTKDCYVGPLDSGTKQRAGELFG